jgi:pyruvate/2-oxoglutarate dehydrogenase complex dihydrolipoamide acyltransferase (E2) component
VRRLVRQYQLDVSSIRGTGPAGRIRVGDVIGLLGRGDGSGDGSRPSGAPAIMEQRPVATPIARNDDSEADSAFRAAAAPQSALATTVFECDVTRVLAHRRRRRDDGAEIALTAYYVAACHAALTAVPEVAAAAGGPAPFLVALSNAEGEERSLRVETKGLASVALDERLLAIDRALREPAVREPAATVLAVHHYGSSGCLLATPTPVAADHAASVGVARVRRQIVVRSVDGDEAPRIAAVGYVTLSFRPERITLARANRYLAEVVRVLEEWPD